MDDKTLIESVCNHKRDTYLPTIVKFQNGSLGSGNADFSIVESNRDQRKRALVLAGQQIYMGDLQDSTEYNTYICLRNKSTNKVQIVPVQQSLLANNVYKQLEKKEQMPVLSKEHATKKLLKEFGSRKASRYVNNSEQMMVNVDVVRQDLDETVQNSTLNETNAEEDTLPEANVNNLEYLATIVPKFDKSATKVSEVYDVDDVVPRPLLDRLDEEAKVVYSTPVESLPIESEYLRDCLKRIQAKEIASKQDFLHIKLIIYMDALQTLIGLRSRQLKKVELSGITEKVENDIVQRFADPKVAKSFTRTTYSTEKALTHFIVLALLISEKYEVDMNVLSRTLRTTKDRIKSYAHIVNARPKTRSDVLSLRLPSTVPALSTSNRFQRKK
ncbi:DNA-directed RNA polymerase I subunit RPA49 [Drosophila tropicalis]|uniref:DNA-directed RNA polymerase I subunit RPA49 n=1 Tax=Drosophila tropicalis TaxID=46794 RepID=UPI0035AB787A